ncbi:unnamed protein product, partial [Owenia fusiformis]
DYLVYPEGVRFRDRLSHGQFDLSTIGQHVAASILAISLTTAARFLPEDANVTKSDTLASLISDMNCYESRFHPISLLKRDILDAGHQLSEWQCIQHIIESCDTKLKSLDRDKETICKAITTICRKLKEYPCLK